MKYKGQGQGNVAHPVRQACLCSGKVLLILKILLILSKNCVPVCFAQGTGKAGKQSSPAVERITDNLYRIGKAVVDTQARTVTCPGQINMDAGSIEYLAVAPRGKTHESLLLIDARPLHLQLALLLLNLEPKNVLTKQGEKTTPQGAPVEIYVQWRDAKGNRREERAETLVAEMPSGRPMPLHDWVFTGSRILPQGFEADLQKSLVAVWHDPAAILDNPLPGGANNAYVVNAKRVPRQGTPIEFVIKAVSPAVPSTK